VYDGSLQGDHLVRRALRLNALLDETTEGLTHGGGPFKLVVSSERRQPLPAALGSWEESADGRT
jgi:hypothetical protein